MKMHFIRLLMGGVLLSFAVLAPASAPAEVFSCSPAKMKGVASNVSWSTTTSPNYVNLAEAAVIFIQGGTTASCVIVRFSAETLSGANEGITVRALLDDVTASTPEFARYAGNEVDEYNAHAFDFVFPRVAPGRHLLRIQYKSSEGTLVRVGRHTTIVQYK